jgi:succinylarginine dihydrolase
LYQHLIQWAQRCYREKLHVRDLGDPRLPAEAQTALDELTQILGLGSFYPFQMDAG